MAKTRGVFFEEICCHARYLFHSNGMNELWWDSLEIYKTSKIIVSADGLPISLKRNRHSSELTEVFGLLAIYRKEVGWESSLSTNMGYWLWKRKDRSECGSNRHEETIPDPNQGTIYVYPNRLQNFFDQWLHCAFHIPCVWMGVSIMIFLFLVDNCMLGMWERENLSHLLTDLQIKGSHAQWTSSPPGFMCWVSGPYAYDCALMRWSFVGHSGE